MLCATLASACADEAPPDGAEASGQAQTDAEGAIDAGSSEGGAGLADSAGSLEADSATGDQAGDAFTPEADSAGIEEADSAEPGPLTDSSEATSDVASRVEDASDPTDALAPEDVPPPPLEPTLLVANTTWEVESELILEGEFRYAWDPSGQELVVQSVDGALYFSSPGEVSAPLEASVGLLQAESLVPSDDGSLLMIASDEGLYVRVDDELVVSPLSELLPSPPLQLLTSGPPLDAWLWLAMDEGLWVFHDGGVFAVEPEEVDTSAASLAFGAPVDGVPSLWGVNASGTWALSAEGEALNLSAARDELSGVSVASDASGGLWVADDGGDLHARAPTGAWAWWRLPEAVGRVEASPDFEGLWIEVGDDLWFHYGEGYGPLETAIEGSFLGIDNKGRALIAREDALWALAVKDVGSVVVEDPPTWAADVEPVFIESCEPCHGKGAYAHPLFEPEQWIEEIELIVFMVTEPAFQPQMPLAPYPPLDNQAVQVILDWRDAGFPE